MKRQEHEDTCCGKGDRREQWTRGLPVEAARVVVEHLVVLAHKLVANLVGVKASSRHGPAAQVQMLVCEKEQSRTKTDGQMDGQTDRP